jgi:hypothetical protein
MPFAGAAVFVRAARGAAVRRQHMIMLPKHDGLVHGSPKETDESEVTVMEVTALDVKKRPCFTACPALSFLPLGHFSA